VSLYKEGCFELYLSKYLKKEPPCGGHDSGSNPDLGLFFLGLFDGLSSITHFFLKRSSKIPSIFDFPTCFLLTYAFFLRKRRISSFFRFFYFWPGDGNRRE